MRSGRRTRRRKPSTKEYGKGHWWLRIGTILTVWTLLLTLFGYGHVFGYLEPFHLSPEQLQLTPLDYLQRSYRALLYFLDIGSRIATGAIGWELIRDLWLRACVVVLILAVGSAVLAYVTGPGPLQRIARLMEAIRRSRLLTWLASRRGVRKAVARIRRFPTQRRLAGYGAPLAILLSPFALLLAYALILWFLIAVFTVPTVTLPLLPAVAAEKFARTSVVEPARCSAYGAMGQPRLEGARCIRVVRQGCEIARGRFIEQGANRVWLLTKRPWNVRSVPLEGNVTEEVEEEQAPAGTAMCQHLLDGARSGGER